VALISCPECRKPVSEHAVACPGCGRPFSRSEMFGIRRRQGEAEARARKNALIVALVFLGGCGLHAVVGVSIDSSVPRYQTSTPGPGEWGTYRPGEDPVDRLARGAEEKNDWCRSHPGDRLCP
jgi:hypothetical protein